MHIGSIAEKSEGSLVVYEEILKKKRSERSNFFEL